MDPKEKQDILDNSETYKVYRPKSQSTTKNEPAEAPQETSESEDKTKPQIKACSVTATDGSNNESEEEKDESEIATAMRARANLKPIKVTVKSKGLIFSKKPEGEAK